MGEINADMTLGDLATGRAGAVDVLTRHGLDFCCGGQRSLAAACTDAGIDPDVIVAELSEVDETAPPEPWAGLGPAELADHIETTHHAYLHTRLETLGALAQKVAGAHGERHPEVLDVFADVRELIDDLVPHLAKEERVLFPMIRQLAETGSLPPVGPPSIEMPIAVMTREHDTAGELLRRMRAHSNGYAAPEDACASYRALYEGLAELEADTHLHIHKENNVLFPAARHLEADAARVPSA